MIELVFSVCLADAPDRCKDVRLTFIAESVTPQQCMLHGQAEIAKWAEGHPNWRVRRWKCGPAGLMAKA